MKTDLTMRYMVVWSNIEYKIKNGIFDFSGEEKDFIIERIVDNFQVDIFHKTDEFLAEYLINKGLVG